MSSRILIVGAGIGGLSLAQGLKKAGIPFHVFERSPAADYRAQGYRIRLINIGAESLKELVTAEWWSLFEGTCAENIPGVTRLNADTGKVILPKLNMGRTLAGERPYCVDRTVLRKLLLSGLEEDVSFGKELKHYHITSNSITAQFSDGTSAEGALLVGAEGVGSPTRKQYLPEHIPIDTDVRLIYGKTPLTKEFMDRFPSQATKGIVVTTNDSLLTLFLETIRFSPTSWPENFGQSPVDYVYWVLGGRTKCFGHTDDELFEMSKEDSVQLSLEMTASFDPALRSVLEFQDPSQTSILRMASALPDMRPWQPEERITLLGDAIHVMPPAGGNGANMALRDAATLFRIISQNGISTDGIGRYEETMRDYAREAIEASATGGRKLLNQRPIEECEPLKL